MYFSIHAMNVFLMKRVQKVQIHKSITNVFYGFEWEFYFLELEDNLLMLWLWTNNFN